MNRDVNDLEKEEVDIVTGALAYKEKTVRSVMTPLHDAYLLSIKTVLDFETISEIRDQGYSRIPVFDGDRSNIVYVLFVKDLMFIDPDDNMPLAMVCEFYKNEVNFVFHDTPLNIMFNEFKSGEKGHMAFVQVNFDPSLHQSKALLPHLLSHVFTKLHYVFEKLSYYKQEKLFKKHRNA